METSEFIRQHANDDVKTLALLGKHFPKVDLPYALDQIRGRQLARTKLPAWANTDGIVYPPHLNMEQCSSEQTALYKQEIAVRLLKELPAESEPTFADLTGGFGVDFSYMSKPFKKALYVERNEQLCSIATQNFKCLGLNNISTKNGDSIEVLHQLDSVSVLFVDPARRNSSGGKVVSMADCEPNVLELCDEMVEKSHFVMLKLSPMLDWHSAVAQLKYVTEVHIVSVGNECKELLLVLTDRNKTAKGSKSNTIQIFCVNDNDVFSYEEDVYGEKESILQQRIFDRNATLPPYLYEPNASIMKAGCFAQLSETYGVVALGHNSHLFVSPDFLPHFPGRKFQIVNVCTLNKKELRRALAGVTQANIAVRNFPMRVDELKKRLKLRDGGEHYIFATTRGDKEHILIISKKEV